MDILHSEIKALIDEGIVKHYSERASKGNIGILSAEFQVGDTWFTCQSSVDRPVPGWYGFFEVSGFYDCLDGTLLPEYETNGTAGIEPDEGQTPIEKLKSYAKED
jgi:hypothetical protein